MSMPCARSGNLSRHNYKARLKVLVATGASGGHIFPALALLDALREKQPDLDTLLVLPKNNPLGRLTLSEYNACLLPVSSVRLSFGFKNIVAIIGLIKGMFESLFIMIEFRPDIVVGFGTLASAPLVLLAWLFRTKTIIHEQNVIPGKANRLLAYFADRIAVSFPQTTRYWRRFSRKMVCTGNPIRRGFRMIEKDKALDYFGLSHDKFTVLVMGGSAGSHRINMEFLMAAKLFKEKSGLQVIHLAGVNDYNLLASEYNNLSMKVKLYSFFKDMDYAYSAADLSICRAGATTITELIFFRMPAIIVPYPFAYAHQLSNAKVVEGRDCAIIIRDSELEAQKLKDIIEGLMNEPARLRQMRSSYDELAGPKAEELLVNTVLSID